MYLIFGLGNVLKIQIVLYANNSETKIWIMKKIIHCTEVRFASFLSGGFTTMAVINPSERKMAKRTSVHCTKNKPNVRQNSALLLGAK